MSEAGTSEDLEPDEVLLRRFSPTNPAHITTDEGSGKPVLNWSALKFDSDGCSVFRERVLWQDNHTSDAILDPPYVGIACTTPDVVRMFTYRYGGGGVTPFYSVASPRRESPPSATDRAHASIRLTDDHGLSKRQVEKACRCLASEAFTVRDL